MEEGTADARLQAMKSINAEKTRALMRSIAMLQKEVRSLRAQHKDHRRSAQLQVLQKEVRRQEMVAEVLKVFVERNCDLSREQVDDFVLKKTVGAPLRFAPTSREELAMEIVTLRRRIKKLDTKVKKAARTRSSGSALEPESKFRDAQESGMGRHTATAALPSLPPIDAAFESGTIRKSAGGTHAGSMGRPSTASAADRRGSAFPYPGPGPTASGGDGSSQMQGSASLRRVVERLEAELGAQRQAVASLTEQLTRSQEEAERMALFEDKARQLATKYAHAKDALRAMRDEIAAEARRREEEAAKAREASGQALEAQAMLEAYRGESDKGRTKRALETAKASRDKVELMTSLQEARDAARDAMERAEAVRRRAQAEARARGEAEQAAKEARQQAEAAAANATKAQRESADASTHHRTLQAERDEARTALATAREALAQSKDELRQAREEVREQGDKAATALAAQARVAREAAEQRARAEGLEREARARGEQEQGEVARLEQLLADSKSAASAAEAQSAARATKLEQLLEKLQHASEARQAAEDRAAARLGACVAAADAVRVLGLQAETVLSAAGEQQQAKVGRGDGDSPAFEAAAQQFRSGGIESTPADSLLEHLQRVATALALPRQVVRLGAGGPSGAGAGGGGRGEEVEEGADEQEEEDEVGGEKGQAGSPAAGETGDVEGSGAATSGDEGKSAGDSGGEQPDGDGEAEGGGGATQEGEADGSSSHSGGEQEKQETDSQTKRAGEEDKGGTEGDEGGESAGSGGGAADAAPSGRSGVSMVGMVGAGDDDESAPSELQLHAQAAQPGPKSGISGPSIAGGAGQIVSLAGVGTEASEQEANGASSPAAEDDMLSDSDADSDK